MMSGPDTSGSEGNKGKTPGLKVERRAATPPLELTILDTNPSILNSEDYLDDNAAEDHTASESNQSQKYLNDNESDNDDDVLFIQYSSQSQLQSQRSSIATSISSSSDLSEDDENQGYLKINGNTDDIGPEDNHESSRRSTPPSLSSNTSRISVNDSPLDETEIEDATQTNKLSKRLDTTIKSPFKKSSDHPVDYQVVAETAETAAAPAAPAAAIPQTLAPPPILHSQSPVEPWETDAPHMQMLHQLYLLDVSNKNKNKNKYSDEEIKEQFYDLIFKDEGVQEHIKKIPQTPENKEKASFKIHLNIEEAGTDSKRVDFKLTIPGNGATSHHTVFELPNDAAKIKPNQAAYVKCIVEAAKAHRAAIRKSGETDNAQKPTKVVLELDKENKQDKALIDAITTALGDKNFKVYPRLPVPAKPAPKPK